MRIAKWFVVAALTLLCSGSCIRPTESRAERDLEIGKTRVGAVSFRVSGGLAAIRSAKAGELSLWSSAPAWTMTAKAEQDATTSWTISLHNVLQDATLSARTEAGTNLPVTELDSSLPTRKRFGLTLPAGRTTTITLAPPDIDDPTPWRFAVLSDVQEAIDEVQDIYEKVNKVDGLRFLLGAGDLTEQGSVEELERFQRELEALAVPYYTTLGNHELGHTPPPFQDMHGRASFSFEFRRVRFSLIDSGSATVDPLVYGWLDDWLARGKDRVHVVAMHIPPVDPVGVRNGSFASRNEAAKLLKRLADGKVDLTLYGHIHSYYDFDNAGIPAYISGGGGAIPERFDGVGRHFLVIDVDPQKGIQSVKLARVD